jgi:hypothetical protein
VKRTRLRLSGLPDQKLIGRRASTLHEPNSFAVHFTVNGKQAKFFFDNGADFSSVSLNKARRLGAFFLLLSMMFRNPTPGALLFLGWEAINPVLPSLLQKLSVASYLRHLMPVDIGAKGFFALLTVQTEPVSGWIAILGLLVLIAVVLLYSCYRIRTLEIRYTTE